MRDYVREKQVLVCNVTWVVFSGDTLSSVEVEAYPPEQCACFGLRE